MNIIVMPYLKINKTKPCQSAMFSFIFEAEPRTNSTNRKRDLWLSTFHQKNWKFIFLGLWKYAHFGEIIESMEPVSLEILIILTFTYFSPSLSISQTEHLLLAWLRFCDGRHAVHFAVTGEVNSLLFNWGLWARSFGKKHPFALSQESPQFRVH